MSIVYELKKLKEFIYKQSIEEDITKIYRFHYLYFNNNGISEMHDISCDPFKLPDGWSKDDAFKIVSYFFDHTNYETDSYKCCYETTLMLNKIGFKTVDNTLKRYKPVDLFVVICNDCYYMFKNSKYYKKYFEWYNEGITKKDVIDICKKYNFDIPYIKKLVIFNQFLFCAYLNLSSCLEPSIFCSNSNISFTNTNCCY